MKIRKKLNEGYTLFGLWFPTFLRLDRAYILVEATEYVKDLQRQVKELQDELKEDSNNDGLKNNGTNGKTKTKKHAPSAILNHGEVDSGSKLGCDKAPNEFPSETSGNGSISKQNQDSDTTNGKAPQMEELYVLLNHFDF
ncbi:Myc-type, basic helix-loop-helix (bHLH) domain containing protein [Parasponia andersonii]|uniref:Myc-type, basic helix-loop-helix (BHLH) domain containing protein n=1 Tax=Parasponia andersonii TaxID=3476 RepID=A0A2P5B8G8_PARAD|nr:Myc-type, basic helix-loop-helix (bHLH) domain containing protein [Parasponia andersonii]